MTVSSGSIVTSPGGLSLTVNSEAAVDENGSVTLSGNGSIIIRGTIVTVSAKGGTITSNGDGTLSIPSGSVITDKNGKRTSVSPRGGTLSRDGAYEDNPDPVFNSWPSTYPPIIPQPDNGHVSVSPRAPKKGDTVTVALTPNGNYAAGNVVVKGSGGSKLEVWDNHDGTYSFTQPGEAVTVEATFVPRSQAMPFFNVWPDDWCYDAVCYVNSRGVMGGYTNGFFRPNAQLTRAMLAQILCNLAGGVSANDPIQYNDVPAGAWYAEAVRWAAGKGIVSGYGDGSFKPDAPITREQFAVMLYRFQQLRNGGSAGERTLRLDYADAESIGAYAREAAWCTANHIMGGYSDGTLRPKGQTTRAQAAAMLMRFCENG